MGNSLPSIHIEDTLSWINIQKLDTHSLSDIQYYYELLLKLISNYPIIILYCENGTEMQYCVYACSPTIISFLKDHSRLIRI